MSTGIQRDPLVTAASFGAHLLALVLPLALIQIFDRAIPADARATLVVLALVICSAALCEVLLRASSSLIHGRDAAMNEIHLASRLTSIALMSRRTLSDEPATARLAADFETIERLRLLEAGQSRTSAFDFPFAVVFGMAFLLIAPSIAWVLLLIAAIVLLPELAGRRISALAEDRADMSKRSVEFLTDAITNIEHTKGLRAEPWLRRRFERLAAGMASVSGSIVKLQGNRRARVEAATLAVPVLVALAGANSVLQGSMTVGSLAAAILLSGRAIQPLIVAQNARDARRRLRAREAMLAESIDCTPPYLRGKDAEVLERLDVKGLTINAPDGRKLVENLSFSIGAFETIALTGRTGAGKTLVLRAISGKLLPDAGEIHWNGVPLSELSTDSLSSRIVLLRPRPKLPDISAIDYMTDFNRDRLSQVLEIAGKLGVTEALAAHPEGFSARLSDGSILSSLKSRLPIVRALARNPDLLLFDEANVELDFESDQQLKQCLLERRGNKATLIVSARPSYVRLANRRLHLSAKHQPSENGLNAPVLGVA